VVWNACTGEDGLLVSQEQSKRNVDCVDIKVRLTGGFSIVEWKNIPKIGIKDYYNLPGKPEGLKVIYFDSSDKESVIYGDLTQLIKDYADKLMMNQTALAAKEHEKKLYMQQSMSQIKAFSGLTDSLDKSKQQRDRPEGFRRPM
jgi:hypothetical protein